MGKRIAILIMGLAVLATAAGIFGYYSLGHALRTVQVPADAQIAFKGALGEAIFAGKQSPDVPAKISSQGGLGAILELPPTATQGKGLIEAYRKDPQRFKRYADMLDTAMNAKLVGDFVLHRDDLQPPRTSEPLAIAPKAKVDAWGAPFCIIPIGEKVAIVSGGPSRLSCDGLPLTANQIAASERNIYAGPSDIVVVIASRPVSR